MRPLTVKQMKAILEDIPDDTAIYLGDDEELNGVHRAYFIQKCSGKEMKMFSQGSVDKAGVLIS